MHGKNVPFSQGTGWAAGAQAGLSPLGRSLCWEPLSGAQAATPQSAAQPLTSLPGALYAARRLPQEQVHGASPSVL